MINQLLRGSFPSVRMAGIVACFLTGGVWGQSPAQSGSISGVVISGEGLPVSDASVYAWPADRPVKGRLRHFQTNEKGRFLISELAPRTYVVYAFKEDAGYPDPVFAFFKTGASHFPSIKVAAGQVSETEVNLGRKGAVLIVRVLDKETGEPIESAGMELRRQANPDNWFSTGSGDLDHPHILKVLVPSLISFSVRVSADGYSDWSTDDATDIPCCRTLVLYPEEERTLVVRLTREAAPQYPD